MPMSQTQSDGSSPSSREKRAKRGPRCLRIWSLSPLRHFQMHLLVLLAPGIICDAANEAALPSTPEKSEPAATKSVNGTNCLRLNFRGASLATVLNYLSDAAGFVIVLESQPRGTVDVWSDQPRSKDQALNLLDSVLHQHGYAALRNGRTLTIVNQDEAKTRRIAVKLGADPQRIPPTDEIVTQILPVRFVEASQLVKDLQPLISIQTTMTANESANSIVLTDTQANIHRIARIIQAIDSNAEDFTAVRVFHLKNAIPDELVDLLSGLFPDESRSQNNQLPFQFGGRGGGPPGAEGFGPGSSDGDAN